MTVTNTSNKQAAQNMDGVATVFSFTFQALTDTPEGIKAAILNTVTGVETELIYNDGGALGYTVSVDADGDGGSITVNDAQDSDYTITIYREYEELQETNYADYNAFPSETVEDNQDLLTFIAQQQSERVNRAIVLPITTTGVSTTLPTPAADEFIGWDSAGTALENKPDPSIAAAASAAAAAASAAAAATSESNAATSETNAASSAATASAASAAASAAQSYAEEWANKAEDSLISAAAGGDLVDDYSALHWANKAAASAASNALPTVTFPGDEGLILVARAAASPDSYSLEAPGSTTVDGFTILDPGGVLETAPFILDNIMLNAMRISENNALTVQALSDGFEDTYTDETGIDATPTVNETFETGSYRTQVGQAAENTKLVMNFDDGYTGSTEFVDTSGNNHVVTANGGALLKPNHYKFGDGALYLDGTDQFLEIPASADFDIFSNLNLDITIEMWIKMRHGTTGVASFITAREASADHWYFRHFDNFSNAADTLEFSCREAASNVGSIRMPHGKKLYDEWHHIALITNGDGATFTVSTWVDGVQSGYDTFSTTQTLTAAPLIIGQSHESHSGGSDADFFSGYMDEVRIYDGDPFTAVPIAAPYFWYTMTDNDAGAGVTDWGTGANTGSIGGGSSAENLYSAGKVTASFAFDGAADFIAMDGVVAGIASDTSGTFTMWINPTVTGKVLSINKTTGAPFATLEIAYSSASNNITFNIASTATDFIGVNTPSSSITASAWNHIAIVQDGSTQVEIYVNGVQQTLTRTNENPATSWISALSGLDNARIGCRSFNGAGNADFITGRIEDVRYYSGVALTAAQVLSIKDAGDVGRYGLGSANITVPTGAYTTDGGTRLLLHFDTATQGEDFIDSSTGGAGSPHSVTATNGASVTGKFGNGFVRFDGTDDYLTAPASTDWDLMASTASDFTISCWIRHVDPTTGVSEVYANIKSGGTNNDSWKFFRQSDESIDFRAFNEPGTSLLGGSAATSASAVADNDWHHLAVIKVGADIGVYVDGQQDGYTTHVTNGNLITDALQIGRDEVSGQYFKGDMDDLHIATDNLLFSGAPVVGLTDTITVPTAATSNVAGTVLHLPFNNNDESVYAHNARWIGVPQYNNAQTPGFGTGSLDFNGSTDYVRIPKNHAFQIAEDVKQDWTVDFWFRLNTIAATHALIYYSNTAETQFWRFVSITGGTDLRFTLKDVSNVINFQVNIPLVASTWYHCAVIKVGSEAAAGAEWGFYINGTQRAYAQDPNPVYIEGAGTELWFGASPLAVTNFLDGQLDGIRISQTNTIFSGAPNNTPDDTITVPVAPPAATPGVAPDMTLQSLASVGAVTGAAPDTIKAYFDLEDIDAVTLNTDITLEVSRDGGTTFTAGTLAATGQQATAGRRLIEAEIDVSAQPDPGVDLAECVYKIESANETQFRIHAGSLIWG